jgi:hypothetical protein
MIFPNSSESICKIKKKKWVLLIAPTKNKNFSFCGSESPEHCPPRHFTSKAPLSFLRKKVKKASWLQVEEIAKRDENPVGAINSTDRENLV